MSADPTGIPRSRSPSAWGGLAVTTVIALAILVGADLLFARVAPPVVLREVDDAVAEYRRSDPTALVLGSSHARSFIQFDELARTRTDGAARVLAVPLEYGKFTGYEWVLTHRLRPLIEQRDERGELVRPSLRDLVVIGEWWDATTPEEGRPATNLPARAWTLEHFLADVWENGITPVNQNYLQQRWRMLFRHSSLVQDHGHGRILSGLKELVRPTDPAVTAARAQEQVGIWRSWIEGSVNKMNDALEWAAVEDIFAYAQRRGLRTTILLYPRMPSSITEGAKRGTFAAFKARMEPYCRQYGVRMVDWSWSSPLTDEHFCADIDHVTPAGSEVLAAWGLEHDLGYLLTPAESHAVTAGAEQ